MGSFVLLPLRAMFLIIAVIMCLLDEIKWDKKDNYFTANNFSISMFFTCKCITHQNIVLKCYRSHLNYLEVKFKTGRDLRNQRVQFLTMWMGKLRPTLVYDIAEGNKASWWGHTESERTVSFMTRVFSKVIYRELSYVS